MTPPSMYKPAAPPKLPTCMPQRARNVIVATRRAHADMRSQSVCAISRGAPRTLIRSVLAWATNRPEPAGTVSSESDA
eukprot:2914847-Prymnesium_polylepis.1